MNSSYLTELHAHAKEVSICSPTPAKELVEAHLAAGYRTLVMTDHLSHWTFGDRPITDWDAAVDHFLTGYRLASQAAEGTDLTVLLGMEICFDGANQSDYLVYGVTEEFLRQNGNLMTMGIAAFSRLAREAGLLVVAAHPFRNFMTVTPPQYLDGIEVHNGNPRHDSRNELANLWADKFGLLKTAGSDFHETGDIKRGGILTDTPITDNQTLCAHLRNGNYTLFCGAIG